jgi:hypothetical protein
MWRCGECSSPGPGDVATDGVERIDLDHARGVTTDGDVGTANPVHRGVAERRSSTHRHTRAGDEPERLEPAPDGVVGDGADDDEIALVRLVEPHVKAP